MTQWVLLNDGGDTVAQGQDSAELIKALDMHEDVISRVLGVNARAILKGAAVEAMANDVLAPMWTWYFSPFDNEHTRVFDPVEMLLSSFKEKMDVDTTLVRIGMPPLGANPADMEPKASAEFTLNLAKKLGLV